MILKKKNPTGSSSGILQVVELDGWCCGDVAKAIVCKHAVQVDTLKVHQHALSLGISVAPGPIFSARHEFTHCLRLNYGHPWDARSEAAFVTLGQVIAAQTGPTI